MGRAFEHSAEASTRRCSSAPQTANVSRWYLLRIPHRWRGPTGTVHCAKRRGASKSLCPPAQRIAAAERMPFLSALEDRAWQALDRGWELSEHRDRAAEVQRRHEEEGRVRGLFAGDDEMSRARCAQVAKNRQLRPSEEPGPRTI